MAFEISEAGDGNLLEIRVSGVLEAGDAEAITAAVCEAAARRNCRRCLIDVRGLRGRLNVIGTYTMVESYPAGQLRVKTAVVDLPEHAEYYNFHETAAQNRMHWVRYFNSCEEAQEWLSDA